MMRPREHESNRTRWLSRIVAVALLALSVVNVSVAQQGAPKNAAPAAETAPAAPAVTVLVRDQNLFPPNPDGFLRGNKAWGQPAGFYLSLWKFVPTVALFFGWVVLGKWVNQDASSLKVNSEFWNSAFFAGGVASMLVGVSMSPFLLGLLLSLALQGLPLGLYIRERNACVPDSARLLTKKHIRPFTFQGNEEKRNTYRNRKQRKLHIK